jgi:hypothetical protein
MTSVTKDLSVQTPVERCGFMQLEYRTGSTVFPKQWVLYFADRGFPVGVDHVVALCLIAGIVVAVGLSTGSRRVRKG